MAVTWDTAATIHKAVGIAGDSTTRNDIWGAASTYNPVEGTENSMKRLSPMAGVLDLHIPSGVKLYGEFNTESDLSQPHWQHDSRSKASRAREAAQRIRTGNMFLDANSPRRAFA